MKSQEQRRIGEQATAAPSSGVDANQPQTAIPLVWFSQAKINRFSLWQQLIRRFFHSRPYSLDGAGTKDNFWSV
jgi:hypothetical protein